MISTRRTSIFCLIFFIVSTFISSCAHKQNKIDTTPVEVNIVRFERELFKLDIYNLAAESRKLESKFPEFFPIYTNRIIEIGDISQEWFSEALTRFVTDQAIYEINSRVQEVLPDLSEQRKAINEGFGRFKTLFPDRDIPTVYTYISGFNQTFVYAPGIIGISLEKFLGPKDPLYDKVYPPIPEYQRRNMLPDKIAVDMLRAFISSEFDYKPEQDNLLGHMLHEGRIMYMLDQLCPDQPDTLLWGIGNSKLDFCNQNEKFMWVYLIENKLLFESDNFRISQFVEEAPFTKDFEKDSPGRAAVWIGYRIVESYMKSNPETSWEELMTETNFQRILNEARYNP